MAKGAHATSRSSRKARCTIGHSHYFNIAHPIGPKRWAVFAEACRSIVAASPVALANGVGRGKPVINASRVSVNGVGDRGCEAVEVTRTGGLETWGKDMGAGWRYVKTYQRPYDVAVCAILAVGRHLGVLACVSSDGKAEDWAPGIALARKATGLPIQDPMADLSEPATQTVAPDVALADAAHAYGVAIEEADSETGTSPEVERAWCVLVDAARAFADPTA